MEVAVGHAFERLAGRARDIIVVDLTSLPIVEQVEDSRLSLMPASKT
jgi:hypothetical protein